MSNKLTLWKKLWLVVATLFTASAPVATMESAEAEETQANGPITLVTWNIQVGFDKGVLANGWPKRKHALILALKATKPDVFCSQEGRLPQLRWIEQHFPTWGRIGGGRDDGKLAGEFCAIHYNKNRLECLKSGTFWLSETPDKPGKTWDPPYPRICTHALFKDKINGTKFVVLSTHFPLNPDASTKAAQLVADRIKKMYENMPTLLCGDFNCEPDSAAWKVFNSIYLDPIDQTHAKTWMLNSKPVACLDAIFKNEDTRVVQQKVLNSQYNHVYPSDHFGLLVKVFIPEIN